MFSLLFAETGFLNVFTDPGVDIFINGENAGQEQVLRRELQEGVYYVQARRNNTVLRSESVTVDSGRVQTVVLDNFQDYRTNVASRGAVEVEAMRLRETRGNFGFGFHGGSPASGFSLKWWPNNRIGLQAIGYLDSQNNKMIDSRAGARVLIGLTDLAFKGSPVTFYSAIGTGRSFYKDDNDPEIYPMKYDLTELALGVEFKIANLYGDPNSKSERQVVITDDTSPFNLLFIDLVLGLGEAFFKLTSFNAEVGYERVFGVEHRSGNGEGVLDRKGLKFSGGMHIYF